MCGIAGRIADAPLAPARREAALRAMRSRGPDGHGTHAVQLPDGRRLDLLHTRLSIIDPVARSDQPFEKDGLTLVYNGEVYNHRDLRVELEALGHGFVTDSDTEVLLEAWRAWGDGALDRLVGMFAFALHDARAGTVVLARDRFGEKPLYLWDRGGEGIYFASEIKVLAAMAGVAPGIDRPHLRRYLVNGYKGLMRDGRTFFDGVRELGAARVMTFRPHAEPEERRYWSLSFAPEPMSLSEARDAVDAAMIRAVSRALRSDMPVALRLSGGIDSNVVAGLARHRLGAEITCFSLIEDDWRYDESAMIAAGLDGLGVPNHQIRIPRDGFLTRLEAMVDYFDGPPLSISYYLHDLVSQAIHDAGFKVALGGTGADEVFSGYYDHALFWLAEMRDHPDFESFVEAWRGTYGRFVRNPHLQDPRAFIDRPAARDHVFLGSDRFARYLTEPFDEPHEEIGFTDAPLRNRMMNELDRETVPVMLHDDDLAAMRWSVENRAPYLDRDLVELVFTIPTEHLVHSGLPKALLRNAGRGVAPEAVLTNPRKQGINAPVTSMVDFDDPEVRARLLDDGAFFDIVDRAKFEALLNKPVERNSDSKFLFSLLAARLFLDRHAGGSQDAVL
jgi:asparagine synthase (glutamine-hydrolysing)